LVTAVLKKARPLEPLACYVTSLSALPTESH